MKSIVLVPLLLIAPTVSPACACDEYQKASRIVSAGAVGEGSQRTVEIRVDNGKVVATVDGKPVAESRIRREGDRIVILGPDGRPMEGVPQVSVAASGGAAVKFDDHVLSADEIVIDGEEGRLLLGPRIRAEIDRAMRQVDAAMGQAGEAGEVIKRYLIDSGLAEQANAWMGDAGAAPAKAPKVMLGVTLQDPDPALRRQLGLGEGETTLLVDVIDGLPAAKAGLQSYDLVIEVDGRRPADPDTIRGVLEAREPGDSIRFTVRGDGGEKRAVEVTLEPFDRERLGQPGIFQFQGDAGSGSMAPLLDALRGQFRMAPLDSRKGDFLFELRAPPSDEARRGPAGPPRGDRAVPSRPDAPRDGARPRPPAGADDDDARLDRLEERLEDMTRRLDRLMEKLERSAG